jgi:hypothetical protein
VKVYNKCFDIYFISYICFQTKTNKQKNMKQKSTNNKGKKKKKTKNDTPSPPPNKLLRLNGIRHLQLLKYNSVCLESRKLKICIFFVFVHSTQFIQRLRSCMLHCYNMNDTTPVKGTCRWHLYNSIILDLPCVEMSKVQDFISYVIPYSD